MFNKTLQNVVNEEIRLRMFPRRNVGFFKKFGYTYREAGVDWRVAQEYGS